MADKTSEQRIKEGEDEVKKALDSLLQKDINELNEENKSFLRARASYLTAEQREFYKSVLNAKPEEKKEDLDEGKKDPNSFPGDSDGEDEVTS